MSGEVCPACAGTGQVPIDYPVANELQALAQARECPACDGSGDGSGEDAGPELDGRDLEGDPEPVERSGDSPGRPPLPRISIEGLDPRDCDPALVTVEATPPGSVLPIQLEVSLESGTARIWLSADQARELAAALLRTR